MTQLSWAEIIATDEFQQDYNDVVLPICVKSIGNEIIAQKNTEFVQIVATMVAILRWHIKKIGDQTDLDLSEFIQFLADEVGVALPETSAIPMKEFLRETKTFYGHKTTETLIQFAGDVIGSAVHVYYPAELIFYLDHRRSFLSGAMAGHELTFENSKRARLRDGIFWAKFVYVVEVLQAQNVINMNDFLAILDSIHPAGMMRFIKLQYNYWLEELTDDGIECWGEIYRENLMVPEPGSGTGGTLDNNFMLSSRESFLSTRSGGGGEGEIIPDISY